MRQFNEIVFVKYTKKGIMLNAPNDILTIIKNEEKNEVLKG